MAGTLLTLLGLTCSGCVTSSPDVLFSTAPTQPAGVANKAGQYPVIGQVPQGQTPQLTPAQTAATKSELNRDVAKGNIQAAQNAEADYQREIASMKDLAEQQRKKRLAEIENNNRVN